MSQTMSWKLTITSDSDIMNKIDNLSSPQQTDLNQKLVAVIEEALGLSHVTSQLQVTFSPESEVLADHSKRYDAAAQLVQVITSDFEGTLYPFAMSLGKHVEAYIHEMMRNGKLDSRLHTLDSEMHRMITEIARHYARTGKWRLPE